MKRTAIVAVALGGISLVAVVSASSGGSPRPYTVTATKACLTGRPHAVVGLPPATPPVPPALFIYSFPRDRFISGALAQLGTWDADYEGMRLTFFKSSSRARAAFKAGGGVWLYGGKVMRNVIVFWAQSSVPSGRSQAVVLGCLRVKPPAGASPPRRSIPRATFKTFAGHWGGHTRGLNITSSGRGGEGANAGCCERVYEMSFQILSVSGTVTRATATYRVTSFKRYEPGMPRLRPAQVGTLRLRNGIVTNTLTRDYFCSAPAWSATAACGA